MVITKQELIEFEENIAELFLQAKIRAPIHLCGDGEDILIDIFSNIKDNDWVFSTHRNSYHALLKGIPKEKVEEEILNGNSMHLQSKEYKLVTSSIVGGSLPIAIGTAMAIKRKKLNNRVWCFVGDMAAEMGVYHECYKYAERNALPITFIIEDNELSVDSNTQECWGLERGSGASIRYIYNRTYPHVGCGQWVTF